MSTFPGSGQEDGRNIRAINTAISLIPSPWPETYCHVLTESWAMGLPVLASDIGTLRERVLRHGSGWLLPVDDASQWLAKLRELIEDRQSYETAWKEIREIKIPDVAWMANQYARIYDRFLKTGKERASERPIRAVPES